MLNRCCLTLTVLPLVLMGCKTPPADPVIDRPTALYSQPLPPGASALRLITDPARMPDLASAWTERSAVLRRAMDQSLSWFAAPSSHQFFPMEGITHERARASVVAMQSLIDSASSGAEFARRVQSDFEVYESVGYDGTGIVLFTGYYAPEFPASRTRTAQYGAPLYLRPDNLVTDPVTGEPQGQRLADGTIVPCPTREAIRRDGLYDGNELAWLPDELSAFLIHVNGSAKLRFDDGSVMFIGYDGKTDRPYASLGKAMVRDEIIGADQVSVPAIRRLYRGSKRGAIDALMNENECFVFFTEYAGGNWPAGSLGVPVSSEASLATDKKIFPRGGVVLVDTQIPRFSRGTRPFVRFMLDQDTGGAIRAPGRADIFMGIGETAGLLAGRQYAEGRLYYFFVRDAGASRGE